MNILIYNNMCFNVDNDTDAARLLQQGARELAAEEIRQYGMAGFEQYVSPVNTVVTADGSVVFSPPQPPAAEELFAALRAAREPRLAEYDKAMAQLQRKLRLATDAGATSVGLDIAAWDAYAQALCDLPEQDGAPWDGGGEETPWPEKPESAEAASCA